MVLKGEVIVYLSSVDWDFNWQTPQEVASALARHGNTVLYVENTGVRVPRLRDLPRLGQRLRNWRRSVGGIRQVADRLYVYAPLALPFPYSRLAQWFNHGLVGWTLRRWLAIQGCRRPLVWAYLPTRVTLDLVRLLDPEILVYYCLADFGELAPRRKVARAERELLARCDVVFAQGELLAQRCRKIHPRVDVFSMGLSAGFVEAADAARVPEDLQAIRRPRLGYVGALQRHVDYALLRAVARNHPDWSIVLIGPKQEVDQGLLAEPNVRWLGERAHADMPRYIAQFDIGLIPYRLTTYTRTVFPSKLNEYLALGKPVVSTPLPEVLAFNDRHDGLVLIGSDAAEFDRCVAQALGGAANGDEPARRRAVALTYDWERRIREMSGIVAESLELQRGRARREWSVRLQGWYRQTRRRLLNLTAVALALYVLVAHSPLLWWVAAPLNVEGALVSADGIAVFAGGVGESGKAGQGYEERVARAAQLFRQGLAPAMIFSSGYRYVMNETDVMKLLAVSLGVPAETMLLESRARNTLENVRFTSALAAEQGWRSLLVVSSPYHMRRSLLVFRRQAPHLRVIPAPVTDSLYFARRGPVTWRQWRAILHEYAGIVYYWWKGWI